jgi:hypothetical protein
MKNPNELSRRHLTSILILGMVWFAIGSFVNRESIADLIGFIQIFLFAFLDLVFLILIFWKVFFTPPTHRGRLPQILIFVFFKLVCLGFLAITLKRLRNAPISVIFMGIGFMGFIWIGPVMVGLLARKKHKD